jgi:hypothetical protein
VEKYIIEAEIFGKVIAYISVSEFQKRGLSYTHMLLIFDKQSNQRVLHPENPIRSYCLYLNLIAQSFIAAIADAMLKFIKKFGKPDLLITLICNSSDYMKYLLPRDQNAYDRLYILTRLCKEKLSEVEKYIIEAEIFCKVIAYISVSKFQKRGLSYTHMLLIFDKQSNQSLMKYENIRSEKIYLRRKLSFDDLETHNFRNKNKKDLLTNDDEYMNCLKDSLLTNMPSVIIKLFVGILINCDIDDPCKLWECAKTAMGEDYKKKLKLTEYNVIIEQCVSRK